MKGAWKSRWFSRHNVLGINGRNLFGIYPHNRREYFPNVDDKLRCKELLAAGGVSVPETYYVVTGPRHIRNWREQLAGRDEFVIKPNRSYGGAGIALVRRDGAEFRIGGEVADVSDVEMQIMQIINGAFSRDNVKDTAFFEQMIDSDGVVGDLLPPEIGGVPDVRLIYLKDRLLMAMMRLPTRESGGRANLHQGGIGVAIDIETAVTGDGCHKNRVISAHPETGVTLRGREMPQFKEMCAIGSTISGIVGLGYIGVDFVIDRHGGPMVLEVNARPGLNIQIANQSGLREVLA